MAQTLLISWSLLGRKSTVITFLALKDRKAPPSQINLQVHERSEQQSLPMCTVWLPQATSERTWGASRCFPSLGRHLLQTDTREAQGTYSKDAVATEHVLANGQRLMPNVLIQVLRQ